MLLLVAKVTVEAMADTVDKETHVTQVTSQSNDIILITFMLDLTIG